MMFDGEEMPVIPKPTPREDRSDKQKAKILACAVQIFIKSGLGGFSLRGVATAAGVRLATIQHYFFNRETLIKTIIDKFLNEQVVSYAKIAKNAEIAPLERIAIILDELIKAIQDKTIREFYLSLWAAAAQDRAIGDIVRDGYDTYYAALSSAISSLRPDLTPERVVDFALSLSCSVDGLCVARSLDLSSDAHWRIVCDRLKVQWLRQL
jgi:AcrR family transcriptional regulator